MFSRILFVVVLFLLPLLPLAVSHAEQIEETEKSSSARSTIVSESIFPRQEKHVHSSTIVELSDGSLLAAWFHGSGECKVDDVCVMGARKASSDSEWSDPFLLADTPGHPDCNPVLWIDNDQQLWLFWSTILANEWKSSLVKYRVSTDYLSASEPPVWHWQDSVHIKPTNLQRELLNQWPQLLKSLAFLPRIIRAELSDTTLIEFLQKNRKTLAGIALALLVINIVTSMVHRTRSRRTGRAGLLRWAYRSLACYVVMAIIGFAMAIGYFAWQSNAKIDQRLGWLTANQPLQLESGEIILPLYSDLFVASIMAISSDNGFSWEASRPLIGFGNVQPNILERSDGALVALMRENGARKRIRFSVSKNQGRDWSKVQETELPNPGSKVNAIVLKNGNWVMAYNDLLDGRHSLRLAVSTDEGASWEPSVLLEEAPPGEASFSYPFIFEATDGNIHITYSSIRNEGETIVHVRLAPSELDVSIPMVGELRGENSFTHAINILGRLDLE